MMRRLPVTLGVVAGLLASPVAAEPVVDPEDPAHVPLWTDRPTRIDPAVQDYERLPSTVVIDPHGTGINIPDHIRVIDSTRFSAGKRVYVMRGVRPIAPRRICRGTDGSRWACGRMALIFLGNLVRGRRLICDDAQEAADGAQVMDCQVRGKRIAAEIIRNGYGLAGDDPDLAEAEAEARRELRGIWKDPACRAAPASC